MNADVDFAQALAGQLNPLGEPLYRKLEPTGYSNRSTDWMNSASLLARLNFSMALVQNKIGGVKVDGARFIGDPLQIERSILFTAASPTSQTAIAAGLEAQQADPKTTPTPQKTAPMIAGLTLGSPDFQRR